MITVILHKTTTNRTLQSQRSASRVHISIIQALSLYAVQSTNQGVPKYSFFEHEHQPKQKVIETGKINFLPQRASERQMPRCIKQELLFGSEDHEGSELCGINARERWGGVYLWRPQVRSLMIFLRSLSLTVGSVSFCAFFWERYRKG